MPSPEDQRATMRANIPEKTGKPLDQWLKLIARSGHEKHGQIVKFLKSEHDVTHGFANLIANRALGGGAPAEPTSDDLIAAQYDGPRAALRPIYDAVVKYVNTLGKDVELAPKKANVSIRRSKQFALVGPATKTRVDLGINLKGVEPAGKLEAWGGMVTHRVKLEKPADLDKDVKAWLKQAYEAS